MWKSEARANAAKIATATLTSNESISAGLALPKPYDANMPKVKPGM